MKKETSKLLVLVTIIVASIILGGFYYISETKKQEMKLVEEREGKDFAQKEKCATLGNSYLKVELRDRNYTSGSASVYTDSPRFAYSVKYNSCFYQNSSNFSSGSEISRTEYYIINLATNEKVASYSIWDKGYDDYLKNEVYIESKKQFDEMSKDIFGN